MIAKIILLFLFMAVLSMTSVNAYVAASITDQIIPKQSDLYYGPVPVTYTVTNTGDEAHVFYMGYSVRLTNWPEQGYYGGPWLDAPYMTTPQLSRGQSYTATLSWQPPPGTQMGIYDITIAVWQSASNGYLQGELDRNTYLRTFGYMPGYAY